MNQKKKKRLSLAEIALFTPLMSLRGRICLQLLENILFRVY